MTTQRAPIIDTIIPETGQLGFISVDELVANPTLDKYCTSQHNRPALPEHGTHTNGAGVAAFIQEELVGMDTIPSSDLVY